MFNQDQIVSKDVNMGFRPPAQTERNEKFYVLFTEKKISGPQIAKMHKDETGEELSRQRILAIVNAVRRKKHQSI